jgi:UDP-arabinose 4-epimerase
LTAVLVTGGAGYIGSHACKALAATGCRPIAYDNLVHGHERAVKWGPLEVGDILDAKRLDEVIVRYSPSAVMHFAAFAYVGESVGDPAKYYRNNVSGTVTLLDAMRLRGVDRIVFSSTCATYGVPDRTPIVEDATQRPINPYGASKLMVERILADYGVAYGLKSIALRYFNAAGADPEGEIGEDHDPETHLIPLVLDAARGARPHVMIFGDDYDTPDGTCVRDYVHVSDLAEAHVRALSAIAGLSGHRAYNLGVGHGISVAEIIEAARRVTRCEIPVVIGDRRPGDPATLFADATRAKAELGWRTLNSDLEKMIATAWRWRTSRDSRPALRETAFMGRMV